MNTKTEIDNNDMIALWKFLGELYGASFTSQYGNQVKTWMKHFIRKHFTPRHLELGMEKCRELCETHSPNLSTFSARCTPTYKEFHLPDEDEAYIMAVKREWRHPIIWHAVTKIGQYDFYKMTEARSRRVFTKQYQKLFRLFVAGEVFVIPVSGAKKLTEPKPSEEEVDKALSELSEFSSKENAFKFKR